MCIIEKNYFTVALNKLNTRKFPNWVITFQSIFDSYVLFKKCINYLFLYSKFDCQITDYKNWSVSKSADLFDVFNN